MGNFEFDTELLISEIKKRPSIWDTSSPSDQATKELRKRDWDEIVKVFGGDKLSPSDRHILAFQVRKRWKNVRTCFARELKRQKNCGSGIGRKSEYVYYKQLLFLTNVMNIVVKEEDEEPEYVYYDDNEIEQAMVLENEFKHRTSDEDSSDKEDEDRLFLLSLCKSLKSLPKNKKMSVKIKMLSVLNEAILGNENDRLS